MAVRSPQSTVPRTTIRTLTNSINQQQLREVAAYLPALNSYVTKCKFDRILGTKQYFWFYVFGGFGFFGPLVIFIYLFGRLVFYLLIRSSGFGLLYQLGSNT